MALRTAPKRKSVDYQKLDELQKEIFGSENEEDKTPLVTKTKGGDNALAEQKDSEVKSHSADKSDSGARRDYETDIKPEENEARNEKNSASESDSSEKIPAASFAKSVETAPASGEHLSDLETIAARIVSTRAGQGRNTTRPFSLPRTLIIDTTRLKSKFRTIDEQFTQNVIIDFLLREALSAVTPENYKDLRAAAFEQVKRAEETTRRSLTVTEEVIYLMSELKAGINLETGRKYSNDEIFSTLLALGVSWLYRNKVLT
jgi:hypothetical protein